VETLEPELTGVQRPPQLVERSPLVVPDAGALGLEHDQVPRPLMRVREADVSLALRGADAVGRHHDGLVCLQSLANGDVEQFLCFGLDLIVGRPSGEQRANLRQRQHRAALLYDSLSKRSGLCGGGADDQDKAPR
jgi:hypothetical protein